MDQRSAIAALLEANARKRDLPLKRIQTAEQHAELSAALDRVNQDRRYLTEFAIIRGIYDASRKKNDPQYAVWELIPIEHQGYCHYYLEGYLAWINQLPLSVYWREARAIEYAHPNWKTGYTDAKALVPADAQSV
jgi:hypothetical protein